MSPVGACPAARVPAGRGYPVPERVPEMVQAVVREQQEPNWKHLYSKTWFQHHFLQGWLP